MLRTRQTGPAPRDLDLDFLGNLEESTFCSKPRQEKASSDLRPEPFPQLDNGSPGGPKGLCMFCVCFVFW